MPKPTHIRILLCTRNGAAHLPAQLQSYLDQSHGDWSLWVSDDNSKDATREILGRFALDHPGHECRVFEGPGRGSAANYLSLLARLPDNGALIALSDQDDVWLPDKLARAAAAMSVQGSDRPVAYASAQIIADATLTRQVRSRPVPLGPCFGNALVQNILSGNSLVLNPALVALIRDNLPERDIAFHDWWIYQMVTGAGGLAIYDHKPSLIYRQHGANVLSANRGFAAVRRRVAMVWRREYARWVRLQTAALQSRASALTPENRAVLDEFAAGIGRGGLARARQLQRLGIRRQSRTGTRVQNLLAALGRI